MKRALTILVVEDNALLLEVVREDLEELGFTVVAAYNAVDGLSELNRHPEVDALFTDIRMPGSVDGWDLAEQARSARPGIPVVYASGYSLVESREVAGSVFLSKPYRVDNVIAALRKAGLAF